MQPASCHRDMPQGRRRRRELHLQGVLTVPGATAAGRGIPGHSPRPRPELRTAATTRPSPATPRRWPVTCRSSTRSTRPPRRRDDRRQRLLPRPVAARTAPGQMYGDNAPGATWEDTFLRAALGPTSASSNPPRLLLPPGQRAWRTEDGRQQDTKKRRRRRRADPAVRPGDGGAADALAAAGGVRQSRRQPR